MGFLQDPNTEQWEERTGGLTGEDTEPALRLRPRVLFDSMNWLKWLLFPRASLPRHHSALPNHSASPSFCKSVLWTVRKLDSGGKKATKLLMIGNLLLYKLMQSEAFPYVLCIPVLQVLDLSNTSRGNKTGIQKRLSQRFQSREYSPRQPCFLKLTVALGAWILLTACWKLDPMLAGC